MKHCAKEELERFLQKKMNPLSRLICGLHLKNCEVCQKKIQEIKEENQMVLELRKSVTLFRKLKENREISPSE